MSNISRETVACCALAIGGVTALGAIASNGIESAPAIVQQTDNLGLGNSFEKTNSDGSKTTCYIRYPEQTYNVDGTVRVDGGLLGPMEVKKVGEVTVQAVIDCAPGHTVMPK